MNISLVFFLCTVSLGVDGRLNQETVMKRVTVRLVRKDWRPENYDPGTEEPLTGFLGNSTQLHNIMANYKNYQYEARLLINATELFDDPNYNSSLPTIILTHPLTIGDSAFIKYTISVLALRNLQKHYNVFAMHAPWLGWYFQITCAQTVFGFKPLFEPMAEGFASFMLDGIRMGKLRPDQISFIGFSYAATLNGYIARVIRDNTGQLTHTILALDAFAHNYGNIYFTKLSASDASYVHMIHSSSALGGTFDRIATVDVVLNNGYLQPGCDKPYIPVGCSHRRSVAVYLYALLYSGNLMARRCESWKRFTECQCSDEDEYPMLHVSFPVNQHAKGTFYVRTSNHIPYAIGYVGTYCEAWAKEHIKSVKNN